MDGHVSLIWRRGPAKDPNTKCRSYPTGSTSDASVTPIRSHGSPNVRITDSSPYLGYGKLPVSEAWNDMCIQPTLEARLEIPQLRVLRTVPSGPLGHSLEVDCRGKANCPDSVQRRARVLEEVMSIRHLPRPNMAIPALVIHPSENCYHLES